MDDETTAIICDEIAMAVVLVVVVTAAYSGLQAICG